MRNKRLLSLLISASLIVGQMGLTGVYAAETTGDEVVTYEEAGFEKPAEVAEDETDAAVNDEVTEQEKSEEAENDANSNDPNAVTEYAPMPTAPASGIRLMADDDSKGEEVKEADIAFVIDTTGSMSGAIRSVSQNLAYFIDILERKDIDLRMSVIDYKDIFADGMDSTVIHHYPSGDSVSRDDAEDTASYYKKNPYTVSEGNIWTVSGGDVKEDLAYMSNHVNGGGDTPETPTDALDKLLADDYGWRDDAHKFVFLLTDAGYKVRQQQRF
ncbi:MAG: VWA domain-containing protein [Lachnospiraceae bacterium]|nr:VWA domain-containing protein [Lachnospiraceae bacterium]